MNVNWKNDMEDEEEIALPGFRFHPTDEELVGFYLRRKVDNKPLSIELIKQVDIYKYDPWDLPHAGSVGEEEGYFFCKRERKYKNSVRPNRVTGSGFWKATGIDKPVYSQGEEVIGLKKTLVYYQGSAGKGTKTGWMMHEFHLPSNHNNIAGLAGAKLPAQEAEIWTLCRIFKRNMSQRKYTSDWREISSKRQQASHTSSNTAILGSSKGENYLSFGGPMVQYCEKKPVNRSAEPSSSAAHQPHEPVVSSSSDSSNLFHQSEFISSYGDWDALRSVMKFAFDPSFL